MIMTIAATTTITKNITMAMTKNIATNMAKIFKQVQKKFFYCLLKMIKKITKIQFALFPQKIDVFPLLSLLNLSV